MTLLSIYKMQKIKKKTIFCALGTIKISPKIWVDCQGLELGGKDVMLQVCYARKGIISNLCSISMNSIFASIFKAEPYIKITYYKITQSFLHFRTVNGRKAKHSYKNIEFEGGNTRLQTLTCHFSMKHFRDFPFELNQTCDASGEAASRWSSPSLRRGRMKVVFCTNDRAKCLRRLKSPSFL